MWNSRRLSESEAQTGPKPGIGDRISAAARALRDLLATRAEIFQEELSEKGTLLGRGAAFLLLAVLFLCLGLLLLTALTAVLLAQLLGSLWLGLLVAFVLYLAVAAGAGWAGWNALSKMRPFDFPESKRGLAEDFAAIRDAVTRPSEEAHEEADLEERFRAGAE